LPPISGCCGIIWTMEQEPWAESFVMLNPDGSPAADQGIPLRQVSENGFQVYAAIHYAGETGLAADFDADVRELPLDLDRISDLASVPASMRWFERPHGAHTPAALFHDYLLTKGPKLRSSGAPVRPDQADLVFRHMLKAVGVPTVKRYVMWTGVALRTRWETSRVALIIWVALSVAGLGLFVAAALGVDFPTWTGGRWAVLVVAGLAPLPASLLWSKQRRAALIAAVMAVWFLPAAVLAALALAVYGGLEFIVGKLRRDS